MAIMRNVYSFSDLIAVIKKIYIGAGCVEYFVQMDYTVPTNMK
jgi:hypothetical protein